MTSRSLLLTTALLASLASTARAITYSLVEIETSASGLAINDAGTVVGSKNVAGGVNHVFHYKNGVVKDLGSLGGTNCGATSINSSGTLVGLGQTAGDAGYLAFTSTGTSLKSAGTLGGDWSNFLGINDSGLRVGQITHLGATEAQSYLRGIKVTSGGSITVLGTLGGLDSFGWSVNNSGVVVGASNTRGHDPMHAVKFSGTTPVDLGTLGGNESNATDINTSGVIVGLSTLASGATHAFRYSGGTMQDLGSLAGDSAAWGINDSGVIVGACGYSDDSGPAFAVIDGVMTDLNTCIAGNTIFPIGAVRVIAGQPSTPFPQLSSSGVYLVEATAINNSGQIVANGSNGHAYLLTPLAASPTPTPTPTLSPTPTLTPTPTPTLTPTPSPTPSASPTPTGTPTPTPTPTPTVEPITISASPESVTQPQGTAVAMTVACSPNATSIQWYKGGVAISGATSATLGFSSVTQADSGDYAAVCSNALTSVTSRFARLTVGAPELGKIRNLSVRSLTGRNGQPLILGFYVAGGQKELLLRAVGPSLSLFGLSGLLADPKMSVHNSTSGDVIEATNDNWGDGGASPTFTSLFGNVGAFLLPDTASRDAALDLTISGSRTVFTESVVAGQSGVALVELYDAGSGLSQRLTNVSVRNYAGTAGESLIVGFSIDGNVPKKVLIRGIGPSLANFGVPEFLPAVKLDLHGTLNGSDAIIATNTDWTLEPGALDASTQAGAFIPSFHGDTAIVYLLPPGNYTAVVQGADGALGVALAEVYEVP